MVVERSGWMRGELRRRSRLRCSVVLLCVVAGCVWRSCSFSLRFCYFSFLLDLLGGSTAARASAPHLLSSLLPAARSSAPSQHDVAGKPRSSLSILSCSPLLMQTAQINHDHNKKKTPLSTPSTTLPTEFKASPPSSPSAAS